MPEKLFTRVGKNLKRPLDHSLRSPRVFVSYSHDDAPHIRWVRRLATDLCNNGVNPIVDWWDCKLGSNLSQFMIDGIRSADRVLLVCTPHFKYRVEFRKGNVAFEGMVISDAIAKSVATNKFVCALRDGNPLTAIPTFAANRLYVDFRDNSKYRDRLEFLLRDIHGIPAETKPLVGRNPFVPDRVRVRLSTTSEVRSHSKKPRIRSSPFPHWVITAGRVSRLHPDRVADRIADAIVDQFLRIDPNAYIACDVVLGRGFVLLSGNVHSALRSRRTLKSDVAEVARSVLEENYISKSSCNSYTSECSILNNISFDATESSSLAHEGVADETVTTYGFASRETRQLLKLPNVLAVKIMENLDNDGNAHRRARLGPNTRVSLGVEYSNHRPLCCAYLTVGVDVGTVSLGSRKSLNTAIHRQIESKVRDVLWANIPRMANQARIDVEIFRQTEGASRVLQVGVNGRRSHEDLYGSLGRGANVILCGRSPNAIARSGTYMARYIAKNIVCAGLADICEVLLSFDKGSRVAKSVIISTEGTGRIEESKLEKVVSSSFNLTPRGIVRTLNLKRVNYKDVSRAAHFVGWWPWEKTNRNQHLRNLLLGD